MSAGDGKLEISICRRQAARKAVLETALSQHIREVVLARPRPRVNYIVVDVVYVWRKSRRVCAVKGNGARDGPMFEALFGRALPS